MNIATIWDSSALFFLKCVYLSKIIQTRQFELLWFEPVSKKIEGTT